MLDIKRKQGVNTNIDLNLKDANGNPYDLSEAKMCASIKNRHGEKVADLVVVATEVEGNISIQTGDTSEWEVGKHEWDILIEFPNGNVISLPPDGVAKWEVIKSITKC